MESTPPPTIPPTSNPTSTAPTTTSAPTPMDVEPSTTKPAPSSPSKDENTKSNTDDADITNNTPTKPKESQSESSSKEQDGSTEDKTKETKDSDNPNTTNGEEPADEAVLAYLQKRGLRGAALELHKLLQEDKEEQKKTENQDDTKDVVMKTEKDDDDDEDGTPTPSSKETKTTTIENTTTTEEEKESESQFVKDDIERKAQEAKSGLARSFLSRSTGGGMGYDVDAASSLATWGSTSLGSSTDPTKKEGVFAGVQVSKIDEELKNRGRKEASLYIESFTALQTWVLALPDDPSVTRRMIGGGLGGNHGQKKKGAGAVKGRDQSLITLGEGVAEILSSTPTSTSAPHVIPPLPPSVKPELMAVCFPLLCHAYCELLEYGLQSDAAAILAAWRGVYEPLYAEELRDLDKCSTTTKIVAHNDQILEQKNAHNEIRSAEKNLRSGNSKYHPQQLTPSQTAQFESKIRKATEKQQLYEAKFKELPFLHRIRTSRLQLSLSSYAYGLLSSFLSRERLIPMSVLLLSRCHLNVENRDPLPYTPACVFQDALLEDQNHTSTSNADDQIPPPAGTASSSRNKPIQWAAPIHPDSRAAESGDASADVDRQKLPFPDFTNDEFNKKLLLNGFRRLEALEAKKEHDDGSRGIPSGGGKNRRAQKQQQHCDPLAPSVMLGTFCASSSSTISSRLEESGIEITCASLSPGDGRKLAAGCEDAAVRIWSMDGSSSCSSHRRRKSSLGNGKGTVDQARYKGGNDVGESQLVLLGHKNGWPVFGVGWSRDGRGLISCGGDGSVRLWDTAAVGPYGRVAKVFKKNSFVHPQTPVPSSMGAGVETVTNTPETKHDDSMVEIGGAALSVYRGHTTGTPVWACRFAPSGFYFASCGADATARIWTTNRPVPVRVLAGHLSSVNCVAWHPNCNYVLTGSDDKTCRVWDVQSGRCVRLLSGCFGGINALEVSPSGRYAAAADSTGVIGIWDLGSGRRVNELRCHQGAIHSIGYSVCGSALASGGDDCTVRIWDVRGAASNTSVPDYAKANDTGGTYYGSGVNSSKRPALGPGLREPVRMFKTKRTVLLDLQYTKRNLLMCAGKYATYA